MCEGGRGVVMCEGGRGVVMCEGVGVWCGCIYIRRHWRIHNVQGQDLSTGSAIGGSRSSGVKPHHTPHRVHHMLLTVHHMIPQGNIK